MRTRKGPSAACCWRPLALTFALHCAWVGQKAVISREWSECCATRLLPLEHSRAWRNPRAREGWPSIVRGALRGGWTWDARGKWNHLPDIAARPGSLHLRGGGSSFSELLSRSATEANTWECRISASSVTGSDGDEDDEAFDSESDATFDGPCARQDETASSDPEESDESDSREHVGPLGKVTAHTTCTGDLRRVLDMIGGAQRIVIVTGAGLSASCGIPTFRGHGQFYESVAKEFGLRHGHEVMDAHVFARDPRPFFKVARRLYPAEHRPSPSHFFIRQLEQAGRLLRLYTQNIDTLERKAGIERVVYCHGSFATATCMRCARQVDGDSIQHDIQQGSVPLCGRAVPAGFAAPAPDAGVAPPGVIAPADWLDEPASSHLTWSSSHTEEAAAAEEGGGGRGGSGDEAMEEDTEGEEVSGDCSREERETEHHADTGRWDGGEQVPGVCGGVLKPNIVLFNEELPPVFERTLSRDVARADLLLVMGTSLSVAPVAHIPLMLHHVPSILINAEPVMGQGMWDILVHGECDEAVGALRAQGLCELLPAVPEAASSLVQGIAGMTTAAMSSGGSEPMHAKEALHSGRGDEACTWRPWQPATRRADRRPLQAEARRNSADEPRAPPPLAEPGSSVGRRRRKHSARAGTRGVQGSRESREKPYTVAGVMKPAHRALGVQV